MATAQEEIAQMELARQEGTDIFYAQQQIIDGLDNLLVKLQSGSTAGTVYVQPVPQPVEKAPNYLLYICIGFVILLLFMRR